MPAARGNEDDGRQLVEEAVTGRAVSTRSCTGRPTPARRPRETGQLRDEATGGRQSQGRHFSTDQEFAMDEIRDLDNPMPRLISCQICPHEIPLPEAVVPEASAYVVYIRSANG